ncbi:MAG: LptF/LptG family permease [Rhodothermia bacterium]|nr:MAG: LptF/LptG family permease [Rhodothermia bacterium]
MTKFDLHIAQRLIGGYLALLGGLIVFFIVLHYVEYIDDFLDRGAETRDVFLVYYPNYVPEIIRLVSPLAFFISAIYLTGRLAQKLELSTLQTSGVSLYRLLVPYVVIGLFVTGFMFWFNGWVVPETNRVRIQFEQDYTKDASSRIDYSNIHRQNRPGSILSVGFFDQARETATTVALHTFDEEQRLIERIDAVRMLWVDSTSQWQFIDPIIRTFSIDGIESRRVVEVLDTTLTIFPRDLARTEGDMDAMTIDEGREYIDELKRSGASRIGIPLVLYYSKFSYPFANLILVILGVPLSSVRRRGGQAILLGTGLFVAFAYLSVIKIIEPFGYTGSLSPVMASWLPHVLFVFVAAIILWRVRK